MTLGIKELNLSLEEGNKEPKVCVVAVEVMKRNRTLDDFSLPSLTNYVTLCHMK